MITPFGTISGAGGGITDVGQGLDLEDGTLSLTFNPDELATAKQFTRNPTSADVYESGSQQYPLSTIWINTVSNNAYILTDITSGSATWQQITQSSSQAIPSITVDPLPSTVVQRNQYGDGYFHNVFLSNLPSATKSKILKVTNNNNQGTLTGELTSVDTINETDIATTSKLDINTLRINGLGAGTLMSDANGNISSQIVSLTATPTFTSINGTDSTNVYFPNGLATNAISSAGSGNVGFNNNIKMLGTTNVYLSTKNGLLSTDQDGKVICSNTLPTITNRPTFNDGIRLNIKNTAYLGADENGNVVTSALNLPVTAQFASLDGLTNNQVNFLNGVATNSLYSYNTSGITVNNSLMMINGLDTYLGTRNYNLLGTDANGKIIAGTFTVPDTLTPSSGFQTFNGNIKLGSVSKNEIIFYNNNQANKLLLYDNRGGGTSTASFIGLGVVSSALTYNVMGGGTHRFQQGSANTFTTIADINLSNGLAIDKIKELTASAGVTISGVLKTDTITPTTGSLTLNGNIKMGSNELVFADTAAMDNNRIVLNDLRSTGGAFRWAGIGSGTGGITDLGIRSNYDWGMTFNVGYTESPFKWIRPVAPTPYNTGKISMMLTYDILQIDTIQALSKSVNDVDVPSAPLEIRSPFKLTSSTYTTAGYLYRNSDGTTAIQTPAAATTMDVNATANTGVLRDSSSDITTNVFRGTAFKSTNTNIYLGSTGADYHTSMASETNTLRLGANNTTATYMFGVYNYLISTGDPRQMYVCDALTASTAYRVGYIGSSRRFKHEIYDIGDRSKCIYNLRPVSYKYKEGTQAFRQYGLIAEEVNDVFPDMVRYDDEGLPITIQDKYLPFLLLNEAQNQKKEIDSLKTEIDGLKTENASLKIQIQSMQNDLETIKQAIANLTKPSIKYVGTPTTLNNGEMIIYEGDNSHLLARWKNGTITKEIDLIQ